MLVAQVAAEAVVAWEGWLPTKNCMPRRLKGVVMVLVPSVQYFPGESRKKKAIQAKDLLSPRSQAVVPDESRWRPYC